jgi:hypothetical protein
VVTSSTRSTRVGKSPLQDQIDPEQPIYIASYTARAF